MWYMTKTNITQEFSTTIKFPGTKFLLEDLLLRIPDEAKNNVNTTLSVSTETVWLGEDSEVGSHEVINVEATWTV